MLTVFAAAWLISGAIVNSATITATSCSSNHVQTAIDAASDGDVVVVPSGSCTWTSGVTISGKGIHLRGQGLGSVTLTHNGGGNTALITAHRDATHNVEISQLAFSEVPTQLVANSMNYITAMGPSPASSSGYRPILIHDNTFTMSGIDLNHGIDRAIRGVLVGGLIVYNNTFTRAGGRDQQAIEWNVDAYTESWSTTSTFGRADVTGLANSYVEDNTFVNFSTQALDVDGNSRTVIRYNRFTNSAVSSHGADSSNVGVRHTEFYNNTFTWSGNGDCTVENNPNLDYVFFIRGGSWLITDNSITDLYSCAWGAKSEIKITVMQPWRNAGPYACWNQGYPVPHQPGRGHNGAEPIYIWNNTVVNRRASEPMVITLPYPWNECGASGASQTIDQYLQASRDYVVDSAPAGYSKYLYPHPARLGLPGAGSAPSPPTGLQVLR